MRLKSTIYESTLSTADAVPLPRWGRLISSGYAEILRLRSQLFWHSLSHIQRFSPLRMTKRGDARKWYVSHSSLAASHSSPISSPISLNRAIQSFASSFFTIWIAMPAWTRT